MRKNSMRQYCFPDGTQGEDDGQNITDPDTDGEGNELDNYSTWKLSYEFDLGWY